MATFSPVSFPKSSLPLLSLTILKFDLSLSHSTGANIIITSTNSVFLEAVQTAGSRIAKQIETSEKDAQDRKRSEMENKLHLEFEKMETKCWKDRATQAEKKFEELKGILNR